MPTASWIAATPYPIPVSGYAFAQNGEDFYVISGVGANPNVVGLKDLRRYNTATNAWTSLADIPVFSSYAPAVYYEGKIYLANGGGASGGIDKFHIYDIATNTWTGGPQRIHGSDSGGAAAGAFNGNVYIVGGLFGGPSPKVSIYNIASNTWSAGPDAPAGYLRGGYAQIGQFLYLIGSWTGNQTTHSVTSMRLDMANNTWSTGPNWTPQRADFGLAAAGTKLFAIGGEVNGGSDDLSTEVNELETSTWPAGTWIVSPDPLPSARQGNRAGFYSTGRAGGEIWSFAGSINGSYLDEHLYRPVPAPCLDYNVTQSTRALVPATGDTGNHCDDCMTASTAINFPFPVTFYGIAYTRARASSNGNLQFNSTNTSATDTNLPAAAFNATIFAFWDNLRTDLAGGGIFTSTAGTAPNRIYTIEWRVANLNGTSTTNFEIRFFEGSTDFEVLYGATTGVFRGTIGIQRDANSLFTQFAGPNANVPIAGTRLLFTTDCCAPLAFRGALGSNSTGYPGSSGTQTGRLTRQGNASVCGAQKSFPGIVDTTTRTYDQYTFTNNGPATCVRFDINSACNAGGTPLFAAAYLGSFNPANLATNYRGDTGALLSEFKTFAVDVPANATVVLVVNEVTAGAACPSYDVIVRGLSCPLELVSAVSRKTHGAAGEFDVPLPLTGEPGVECRSANATHKLVFTFDNAVTAGSAAVTAGMASAGPPSISGTTIVVPLSAVVDLQKVTVTLSSVTSSSGQVLPNIPVSMNVLLGDTNGDRFVNSGDSLQTRNRSGQVTAAANFRSDVNVSGAVNSGDSIIVRSRSGNFVP